jgi:hypothetical protein
MMKKALLVAAMLALAPVAAMAANNYTSAGCGLGTILFKGKNGKVHLILAATTNGSFGNQTFGISSETLDCTAEGVVKNDKQVEVYAAVNFQRLSREMAQGGGEYVNGLADLMGAKTAEQKAHFAALTQKSYEKIFTSEKIDSNQMLANLRAQLSTATL